MDLQRKRARELRNAPTPAEYRLWQLLRRRELAGHRFRRQVPILGYIVDFVCPKQRLIIELDGSQHLEQQRYDADRTARLAGEGYRVLRYWNDDVMRDPDAVLGDILQAMEAPRHPSPTLPFACGEREGDEPHS